MLIPSIFGENLLDDFFGDPTFDVAPSRRSGSGVRADRPWDFGSAFMRTDVKEKEGSFEIDMDLPGYKKEDVQAELKDGYLKVSASRNAENEEKDENGKFLHRERFYGSCSRTFFVGKDVTQADIKARFEDGVLKIDVPKKEALPEKEKQFISIEG